MKRKIFPTALILIIILATLMSTGCHKVDVLTSCDFSVDNVVEMRYSSSPGFETAWGTIYAINKETGDEEKFAAIANAWAEIGKKEYYQAKKPINMFKTGGTRYYECKFKDGTSIKITRDNDDNLYFNDGKKSYRIKDKDALPSFHDSCTIVAEDCWRYVVGFINDKYIDRLNSGEFDERLEEDGCPYHGELKDSGNCCNSGE